MAGYMLHGEKADSEQNRIKQAMSMECVVHLRVTAGEGVHTAAFVADGAVGDGAALGDGHGHGGLHAGLPRRVGQHDGAEALGVAPDAAHLGAAARRHPGARVLRRRRARGQLERHLVHGDAAALPGAVCRLHPGEAGSHDHRDDAEAPRLELHC